MAETCPRTASASTILALLRAALTRPYSEHDPIREAGDAVLSRLSRWPREVVREGSDQLQVGLDSACWRRAVVDARLWTVVRLLEEEVATAACRSGGPDARDAEGEAWTDAVIEQLDMALIVTGAPTRRRLIHRVLDELEAGDRKAGAATHVPDDEYHTGQGAALENGRLGDGLPAAPAAPAAPQLRRPVRRQHAPSLSQFAAHLASPDVAPLVLLDAIAHWPALAHPSRAWHRPAYLLARTMRGRRLVPVETGRSYVDDGWSQRIVPFGQFLDGILREAGSQAGDNTEDNTDDNTDDNIEDNTDDNTDSAACAAIASPRVEAGTDGGEGDSETEEPEVALLAHASGQTHYLAQHDLFMQIPALRADIAVPDYCYLSPDRDPPQSPSTDDFGPSAVPSLDEDEDDGPPWINVWMGPSGTVSPLHTDPHHNILAQVFGRKYVRLHPPSESARLYPRSRGSDGSANMSNTSQVDVGRLLPWCAGSSSAPSATPGLAHRQIDLPATFPFPLALNAEYSETVLGPGECLFIPRGWWHYVRSLSVSCSVSFWWD